MMMSLEAKNKLGFINGTIKAPSETDPKYRAWRQCNQIIKSWILNSISPSLTNTVIFSDTALMSGQISVNVSLKEICHAYLSLNEGLLNIVNNNRP
jgi:hypothetical protein